MNRDSKRLQHESGTAPSVRPKRESVHSPVMAREVVEWLRPAAGGVIVDCTVGDGGHAAALLSELDPPIELIGIDRDADALSVAAARLGEFEGRFRLRCDGFDSLGAVIADEGHNSVAGILYDLGVSSPQLDSAERGFSYQNDGPLDMRMDRSQSLTADEVVNTYDAARLAMVISRYGQERFARRIAGAIERSRPVSSTGELARTVVEAIPAAARRHGRHPARRTFQAIRIEVNRELDQLEASLPQALAGLEAPGGRLVVLTYHSLEDRVVKRFIAKNAKGCECPPDLPVCGCGNKPKVRNLTGSGIRPSADETLLNRRSQSARLRCAVRTAEPLPGEGAAA